MHPPYIKSDCINSCIQYFSRVIFFEVGCSKYGLGNFKPHLYWKRRIFQFVEDNGKMRGIVQVMANQQLNIKC